MPLAPSPYPDHADLRPAIIRKGNKTFHLADAKAAVPACDVDPIPERDTVHPKRLALRRGLTLCSKCAALEEAEPTE